MLASAEKSIQLTRIYRERELMSKTYCNLQINLRWIFSFTRLCILTYRDQFLLPLYTISSHQNKSQDCIHHYILCLAYYSGSVCVNHELSIDILKSATTDRFKLFQLTLVSMNKILCPLEGIVVLWIARIKLYSLNKFSVKSPWHSPVAKKLRVRELCWFIAAEHLLWNT